MIYLLIFVFIFVSEIVYFKMADRYNIIDKPNHRSSHSEITIRGGGVIFSIALLLWFFLFGFQYPFFVCGVVLISVISFMDDLNDISKRLRMAIHIASVSLLFYQLNLFAMYWWLIPIAYVLAIGTINAYNFMDGINGLTGVYSMVLVCSMLWINKYQVKFVDDSMLVVLILSLIVFLFFNFRKSAACFAGDVGSISIAVIACFLLARLIIQTSQPCYAFMLSVYGIDAICTIFIRMVRKENIFEAHRLHLYQLLVNQRKQPHLVVALLYGAIQVAINFVIQLIIADSAYFYLIGLAFTLLILYIGVRFYIEGINFFSKSQTKS